MIKLNPDSLKTWQDENLEHLRYDYPDVKPGELILDIGSYQREWSNMMIHKYGVKAECFDPLDNRAAWCNDGKIEMGGQYYYTSAVIKENSQWFKCVDIAPFLQNEVAVLKMNIEGGEYFLLGYIILLGLQINVRHLQIQFHEIEGQDYDVMYKRLAYELSETHELKWRYPYCWESWTRKSIQ